METEKVCVNLSAAEVGKLDLLVAMGQYVSRTDVVRAALRREFEGHDWAEIVERDAVTADGPYSALGIGYFELPAWALEQALGRNEKVNAFCAGIVVIGDDVSPDLADRAIGRLRVLGSIRGPKDVLERIKPKISKRLR